MITPTNRTLFQKQGMSKTKILILGIIAGLLLVLALGAIFFLSQSWPEDLKNPIADGTAFSVAHLQRAWANQDYRQVLELCEKQLAKESFDTSSLLYSGLASFYIALSLQQQDEKKVYLLKANEYLLKILVMLPQRNNSDIEYILGKSYFHMGYYYEDESYHFLTAALDDGYVSYDLYEYLGLLAANFNNHSKALDYFNMSLAIEDRDIVYLAIANTHDLMGNTEKAMEVIDSLLKKSKDNIVLERAYLKKADIDFRTGKLDDAEQIYQKVLELNASSADALFYLGEIQSTRGDGIKARAYWRQAYQIDQKHAGAINRLSS